VGAENLVTSRDLHVLVDEAAGPGPGLNRARQVLRSTGRRRSNHGRHHLWVPESRCTSRDLLILVDDGMVW